MFNWMKWAAVAAIVALLGGAFFVVDKRAYERAQADAMERALERLKERGLINEEVADLSDCELLADLGVDCLPDASGD